MLIENLSKSSLSEDMKSFINELTSNYDSINTDALISIDDLLGDDLVSIESIVVPIQKDHLVYESVLFRVHYFRNKDISKISRKNICVFLIACYYNTLDVRFFNEYLFFTDGNSDSKKLDPIILDLFFTTLDSSGCHPNPFTTREDVELYIKGIEENSNLSRSKEIDLSKNVGLIGAPFLFGNLYSSLTKAGFNVKCFFVPYHPSFLGKMVLKNPLFLMLINRLKNIGFSPVKLSEDYKSESIYKELSDNKLSIGYHRLGFIIKSNIINAYKDGLINDHWAVLPFVRGRSTVEYSVLMGLPVAVTSHLVEEQVDSGAIIAVYNYDDLLPSCNSVADIHQHISKKRDCRALDSLLIMARKDPELTENSSVRGLMYYSIHDSLISYINRTLL